MNPNEPITEIQIEEPVSPQWNRSWNRTRAKFGYHDISPGERRRVLTVAFLALALFGSLSFFIPPLAQPIVAVEDGEEKPLPNVVAINNPFADIALGAQSAVVYDVMSGEVLYERNAEAQLPLASITKVMTALVAAESLKENSQVAISERALLPEGDWGLPLGSHFSLKDLLRLTLVSSANDGAAALALASEEATHTPFVDAMNAKAAEIGLAQTYFLNETGLDEAGSVAGGYGSAHDVALLFSYIVRIKPEVLEGTEKESVTVPALEGPLVYGENTNKSLRDVPFLIASKTGYTDLAGGNLAVAFDLDLNRPVVAVVLGSTEEGRFTDIKKLVDATRKSVSGQ